MPPDQGTEQPSIQQGQHNSEAAHALFAATAQVGLALRESQDPVAELGRLCANLAQALSALRAVPQPRDANDSTCAAFDRGLLDRLQADVYEAIQQLQFHDRMVQHLTRIQEYLLSVAIELGSGEQRDTSPENLG